MLRRKCVPLRRMTLLTGCFLRSLLLPKYTFSAIVSDERVALATFNGAEIGRQIYYFDGGSATADGSGWLLKMSLMHDFYRRQPTGRFVMGCEKRKDDSDQRLDGWKNAARYRRDARVSRFPNSKVTFTFDPRLARSKGCPVTGEGSPGGARRSWCD